MSVRFGKQDLEHREPYVDLADSFRRFLIADIKETILINRSM